MSTKTDWKLIKTILPHCERILKYGPPGTGKTYLALTEIEKDRSLFAVTITPEMPAAELRGHYIPSGGDFVWKDGPAIQAWRSGGRLVINEIDHATGDVLSFLHNLLDDPEHAIMTLPTGETIRPKPGFQVIATMNGRPEDLPEALRSRFPVTLEINCPNPAAIEALPEDLRSAAAGSCINPDENLRINLRSWFEFHRLRNRVSPEMAAKAVFGQRYKDILNSIKVASVTVSSTPAKAKPGAAAVAVPAS